MKMGVEYCQTILRGGANDFGGTLMEETISRMAGAEWGIRKEPDGVRRRDPRDRPHSRRANHAVRARRPFLASVRRNAFLTSHPPNGGRPGCRKCGYVR